MSDFDGVLGREVLRTLLERSDDMRSVTRRLSEIYDDVPPDLDIQVRVLEVHLFSCAPEKKKRVLDWLNLG